MGLFICTFCIDIGITDDGQKTWLFFGGGQIIWLSYRQSYVETQQVEKCIGGKLIGG